MNTVVISTINHRIQPLLSASDTQSNRYESNGIAFPPVTSAVADIWGTCQVARSASHGMGDTQSPWLFLSPEISQHNYSNWSVVYGI
jgi:hypothetical protein